MIFLIIISSFIIVRAAITKQDSNVIKINDICYDKEVLSYNLATYSIAVDYAYNTVYFSYSENEEPRQVAKLDLNTKEFKTIEVTDNNFAQAVDQKTHDVYLGGDHGIFKYNPNTDKIESLGENDTTIWSLFYKDTLYYTEYPSELVYTLTGGKSSRLEDMKDMNADTFIIDNEDDMFYSNSIGLYSQKKGTKDAVLYRSLLGEVARGLTTDVNGNAYVCLDTGIYTVNKETKTLEKVFSTENGNGIAFDKDNNIIYGDSYSLIRLKPSADKNC